ncbi:MAG: NAD(P)H-binding protein [Pseudomonadota bacterium]
MAQTKQTLNLMVLAGDGATGAHLVEQASAAGHRVIATVHACDGSEPDFPNVKWVNVDLLKPDGLAAHLRGCDAVLNAVGIDAGPNTVLFPPPLHTEGTLNLITAMREADVTRLVTISASFVASMDRGPIWFRLAAKMGLRAIFREMAEMERLLRVTQDIEWTAVRPGWLLDEAAGGEITVTPDVIPPHLIRTRTGDLAAFMLRCVEDRLHIRETPAIAAPEPDSKSGPDAVLREVFG